MGVGETGEEQASRKKKMLSRSRSQGGRAERILALGDRKDSHGGHPGVADRGRTARLSAGLRGLPRGRFG